MYQRTIAAIDFLVYCTCTIGKLGALIGILAFKPLSTAVGIGPVLIVCACISCIALLITELFVQDDALSDSNGSDESCDLQDSFDNDVDNSESQLTDGLIRSDDNIS
jgi:hypothetical protein